MTLHIAKKHNIPKEPFGKSYPENSGEFITRDNERYYVIRNVDKMPAFFITVVSNSDHWLFVSSNGGLTAGRVSPNTALFPYGPVDRIEDSAPHTGAKTLIRVGEASEAVLWEPFNEALTDQYRLTRNLYKNTLGNKLSFEEVNHDLNLVFRYTWMTSDEFGFVRSCELENLGEQQISIELLDGLQNLLPGATPREVQSSSSNLVNAYKWNELDSQSGLGTYSLYSAISDRAAPAESLWSNTVFSTGFKDAVILLSERQLTAFRQGLELETESQVRGLRGAYLINTNFKLGNKEIRRWQFVANVDQTQTQLVALRQSIVQNVDLEQNIARSVNEGSESLIRIMAAVDGFQLAAEENVSVHHYANVLFNSMRGGVFDQQYSIDMKDFIATLRHFNVALYEQYQSQLSGLPSSISVMDFTGNIQKLGDKGLERLANEYLPITFGRRHGDPSRPWNEFAIKLRDEQGNPLLYYQGNWRDIFQNWEALLFSYPEFTENIIAKFVNASTVDGYNPYRITKEGIDWEVQEEDNPWSYIGYWGDHQIIYLLKLLELSQHFHPGRLNSLLRHSVYSYANVPYRIKSFEALCNNPKDTVDYDFALDALIQSRVREIGADGKLLLGDDGQVYQVNLMEKLLVPVLSKLGNLVVDGGIWLNAQRPEWNDANNALVGHGLSMVTLYYLRRHVHFLQTLLQNESEAVELSTEVAKWLQETGVVLAQTVAYYTKDQLSGAQRLGVFRSLQQSAERYRIRVYAEGFSGKVSVIMDDINQLLSNALKIIDVSIANNRRDDGMYHAYNLLDLKPDSLDVNYLYPMLEGQVAALSAGSLPAEEVSDVLDKMFKSPLYRDDQRTFILYPDRDLPGIFEKNCISPSLMEEYPLLSSLLALDARSILEKDAQGNYRFNASLANKEDLDKAFDVLVTRHGEQCESYRAQAHALYEAVFNHKSFTGRSGGMFGFEGLGSIYWHMVSKLLLAAQENYFMAQQGDPTLLRRLGKAYYRIREGIGFNKMPDEYGAFPTDPYSHTPKHAGAQQPGMTGQVKEEVLTRFGELGIRVSGGCVTLNTSLLRQQEFLTEPVRFDFIDAQGKRQGIDVPVGGLAFTWCQVPFVYLLSSDQTPTIVVDFVSGAQEVSEQMSLSAEISESLFKHRGEISRVTLSVTPDQLYQE